MKKRSLFAAVAMLIVSAIVLTSATYAWFAASAQATMDSISATIKNDQGGILLSTDKLLYPTEPGQEPVWKTELHADDFTGLPEKLTPVSCTPNTPKNGELRIKGGSLTGQAFTCPSEDPASSSYISYKVYVKAQVGGTLNVTKYLDFGGLNFIYAYVSVWDDATTPAVVGTPVLLSNNSDNYTPIKSAGSATDNNGNGIIETGETGAGTVLDNNDVDSTKWLATTKVVNGVHMDAGDILAIQVYVWAEGQDAQCTGTVQVTEVKSGLTFSYAAEQVTTVASGD